MCWRDETDGRAIVNRNDLEAGLKQVVRDSSAYYLLGYNSTQAPTDGKFHEIKVRVKRQGADVRARKGYWALTAAESTRVLSPKPETDPAVTAALAPVQARRQTAVRTWIGTAPGENGRTRVTFVWEPMPAQPGEQKTGTASSVGIVAGGNDGAAYFRGKVVPDTGGETPAAASRAARTEFEAVPGRMQLRLSVEGADGRVLDTDMLDVDVPDYTQAQIQVTTPSILRARTAREFNALVSDPAALPVAGREFRRTERLLIRFAAKAPGESTPETSVRLLNRTGQPMTTLQAQRQGEGSPIQYQVDLPLASLPAGEYILEVKSSAAGIEAKQLLGFRVIS